LPFSPQHLSVSLPQAFFCSAEDWWQPLLEIGCSDLWLGRTPRLW
jgi:hypothetical protein